MQLEFVWDQVEIILEIIKKRQQGQKPASRDWERLFNSRGYCWLKAREEEMRGSYSRPLFQEFIMQKETRQSYPGFLRTLGLIREIDHRQLNANLFNYLPEEAVIDTRIVPLIKPESNSFVFRAGGKLNIFIYLNPGISRELLVNKLTHELYHVGFDSLYQEEKYSYLPGSARKVVEWLNAFGEGLAMLAAAPGPENHPNQYDSSLRELWDRNITNYPQDFKLIEAFLLRILDRKLQDAREIFARGLELMTNNGGQGSWYTVGWKQAVLIEQVLGKKVLIEATADLPCLLSAYNRAVEVNNVSNKQNLPRWSERLVSGIWREED